MHIRDASKNPKYIRPMAAEVMGYKDFWTMTGACLATEKC